MTTEEKAKAYDKVLERAKKAADSGMVRMFYQYPNTARQWYDGLPKVTMD